MIGTTLTGLLVVHIAAGIIALITGLTATLTRKGGKRHRQAGGVFVLTMGVVIMTAVPLSLADANLLLLTISVFSAYLVFNGYRVLARKRPMPGAASPIDWAGHMTMLAFGIVMLAGGIWMFVAASLPAPILLVFGLIALLLVGRELHQIYRPSRDRMTWFYRHIEYMGGAFIATVTASVTVNLPVLPPLVQWLGPTLVGVPLIRYSIHRHRSRFQAARTPSNPPPA